MTTLLLSHKVVLDITCKQDLYFRKACGIARFAWNWGLAKWQEKYKSKAPTNGLELKKEFNALKTTLFPWVYEVTKYACQQPFIYLQRAFDAFFAKRSHYPKFKKKGVHDSFYVGGDQIKVAGMRVKIPNLGWVRLRESLRFEGKIQGATISRKADKWFISFQVEVHQKPKQCENQAKIGIDVGIKTLATLSNGEEVPNIKALNKKISRLQRSQRRLSKCQKGSKNRDKARAKVSKLHYRIACQRNDHLHKLTTRLTENYRFIAIEDLDISEMLGNKRLSREIMDGSWYEFRRQLIYKSQLRGNSLIIADRWYASSKKCSNCGFCKKELALSERIYKCTYCNIELGRDLNAAICLEQLINTVSSTEIQACGQKGSVIMLKTSLQPVWVKQELSHV